MTSQEGGLGCRIFVGNVDTTVASRKEIRDIFDKYGKITDDIRSLQRGYCFVQYDNPESARRAVAAENGRIMGSKRMGIVFK